MALPGSRETTVRLENMNPIVERGKKFLAQGRELQVYPTLDIEGTLGVTKFKDTDFMITAVLARRPGDQNLCNFKPTNSPAILVRTENARSGHFEAVTSSTQLRTSIPTIMRPRILEIRYPYRSLRGY